MITTFQEIGILCGIFLFAMGFVSLISGTMDDLERNKNKRLMQSPIVIQINPSALSVDMRKFINLGDFCIKEGIPFVFQVKRREEHLLYYLKQRGKELGYSFRPVYELGKNGAISTDLYTIEPLLEAVQ